MNARSTLDYQTLSFSSLLCSDPRLNQILLQLQAFYDSEFGPSVILADEKDSGEASNFDTVDDEAVDDQLHEGGLYDASHLIPRPRVIFATDEESVELASAHLPIEGASMFRIEDDNFLEKIRAIIC